MSLGLAVSCDYANTDWATSGNRPYGAVSIAPAAQAWLRESQSARILNVFDPACNLINERREVVSVVAPEIGNGPFNIVTEDASRFVQNARDLRAGVVVSRKGLTLGDAFFDTRQARCWSPQPDWAQLHHLRETIRSRVLEVYPWTPNDADPDSLGHSPKRPQRLFIDPHPSLVSLLCAAVATANIRSCRAVATRLAGCGNGLTPAGDDLILGAILAAWIIHPPERASCVAASLVETAIPLTTALSAAWLRAASRGQAGEMWHTFFRAILAADASAIYAPLQQLLSIGHTSGADALAGFAGSLNSWSRSDRQY